MYLFENKLTLVSVPKCACSTLKAYFFVIQNGFEFKPFKMDGKRTTLHMLSPSVPFNKLEHDRIGDHTKITIVRSPLNRIVSCYEDKIISGAAFKFPKSVPAAKEIGLDQKPSFEGFVERLEDYRKVSGMVRHHSRPLRYFLGKDPSWYDQIFDISKLADVEKLVQDKTGTAQTIPHRNKSKKTVDRSQISSAARDKINQIYASDLDLYGTWIV